MEQQIRATKELAAQHAGMVEVCLLEGNYEKAHAVIDRAKKVASEDVDGVTVDSYLATIFTPLIANRLAEEKIMTIRDLISKSPQYLSGLGQISWVRIRYIEETLAKLGFRLGTDTSKL